MLASPTWAATKGVVGELNERLEPANSGKTTQETAAAAQEMGDSSHDSLASKMWPSHARSQQDTCMCCCT
jgi:hypothetical protein